MFDSFIKFYPIIFEISETTYNIFVWHFVLTLRTTPCHHPFVEISLFLIYKVLNVRYSRDNVRELKLKTNFRRYLLCMYLFTLSQRYFGVNTCNLKLNILTNKWRKIKLVYFYTSGNNRVFGMCYLLTDLNRVIGIKQLRTRPS